MDRDTAGLRLCVLKWANVIVRCIQQEPVFDNQTSGVCTTGAGFGAFTGSSTVWRDSQPTESVRLARPHRCHSQPTVIIRKQNGSPERPPLHPSCESFPPSQLPIVLALVCAAPVNVTKMQPKTNEQAKEVALDSATGDFYVFDFNTNRWVAEGNVGIQKIGTGIGGVAAAILADAAGASEGCGSTKVCCIMTTASNALRQDSVILCYFTQLRRPTLRSSVAHYWLEFARRPLFHALPQTVKTPRKSVPGISRRILSAACCDHDTVAPTPIQRIILHALHAHHSIYTCVTQNATPLTLFHP